MEVVIETRKDHVLLVASGAFDLAAAHDAVVRVAAACRAAQLDRVLVDGRGITTEIPVMYRYELAKVIADQTEVRMRMGVVVTRENMFSKTLENTAQNLGVDVHTTESMAEALIFLDLMA